MNCITDTGETIAALLLKQGLINDKQLVHAKRVRTKLGSNKTLLNVMLDLEYFSQIQFNEALKKAPFSTRLGDLLVELGDISAQDLEVAIHQQKQPDNQNKRLGEILVEHRLVKEKRLIEVLSNQLGFVHQEPDYNKIDQSLLLGVSAQQCEYYRFIPIERVNDVVVIASTEPNNHEVRIQAEKMLNSQVKIVICSQFALDTALHKFQNRHKPKEKQGTQDDSQAMKFVEEIFQAAIQANASDIHIEPTSTKLRIRFRTDSVLWQFKELSLDLAPGILTRLKVMSKADIAERRRHQDGKIEYKDNTSGQIVDIRCSFYVSVHGEKACLRLLNRRTELLNIEQIGMAPAVLERFKYEALEVPSGVVMITGPTGSGKTTTLYSCVDYLNNDDTSIITAEEPVEYVIDGIVQCSLNPKIDMTFAETLRHMVRQDPDVIVLGEIRDQQSAEAAIQSALTGHKVLTTFHTEDTIGGLLRLMNMNIETFLISSTVVSVLAQRLLKKTCEHCSTPYRPSALEMQRAGIHKNDLKHAEFCKGAGCEACKFSGYSGRISVFELLVMNEMVKDAILNRKASYEIRRICIESSGLITLLEDGIEKASRGLTTMEEVIRMLPCAEKPRPINEIRRISRSNDV